MPRLLPAILGFAFSHGATAAVLIVDTSSDTTLSACDDIAPNDCSLRGAITRANQDAGADLIAFDLPLSDPGYQATTDHWRIAPVTNLPLIQDDLTIDGYTQPGALANTLAPDQGGSNAVLKIELRGFGGGSTTGLDVGNGNPHLLARGLAINNFTVNLQLQSPGPNVVEGCFVGTDITGLQGVSASPNSVGIRQRGQAVIGGTAPAARNVISGNGYIGLWDESATTTVQASTVEGNLFGLGADGVTVLPDQDYGIYVSNPVQGSRIGGDSAEARNLFGGNTFGAILFNPGSTATLNAPPILIQGNYFGTDWSGTLKRPNGTNPGSPSQPQPTLIISRSGRCGVQVGGDDPGEGNLIANAATAGIHVATCSEAALLGNQFSGNAIGIDNSPFSIADGATANDANDIDEGGNRLQNTPVVEQVSYLDGGATMQLAYRVDSSTANAAYPLRIDIGSGPGGQMLVHALIDTYAAGDAQNLRVVSFPTASLGADALVLTATDANGNTSEFHSDALFDNSFEE